MPLESSILKVLAYFDLFNYPVSGEEIFFFLDSRTAPSALPAVLGSLVAEKRIYRHDGLFSLRDDRSLVTKRLTGNVRAGILLSIAAKNARFLFQFPFVRGIGVSGSLSKNYADENADIDYFVITHTGRLWIARTLMHLYKKLTFLTGRQHRYCMNYYIDEKAIEIEEKNEFTAIELVTLKPFCGNGTIDKLFSANDWALAYYPNSTPGKGNHTSMTGQTTPGTFKGIPGIRFHNSGEGSDTPAAGTGPIRTDDMPLALKDSRLKKILETCLSHPLIDRLDDYCLRVTSRRWKKKEEGKKVNMKGLPMALQTGKHYAKPNPAFLQRNIMRRFSEKLRELGIRPAYPPLHAHVPGTTPELTPNPVPGCTPSTVPGYTPSPVPDLTAAPPADRFAFGK